jgi:hypothetical protein
MFAQSRRACELYAWPRRAREWAQMLAAAG